MLKAMLCVFFKTKSINISCLIYIYSWSIFFFYDAGISLFSISRVFSYTKVIIEYVLG